MEIKRSLQDSAKSTLKKYSANITAVQIAKECKSKSLIQCREGDSFTLATARKENGIDSAEKVIKQFTALLGVQLNLNKVSPESVDAIAEDVYEIAYFLKVEELAFFFRQLRKGVYGQMYENLNSEKVCTAMRKFLVDRANYFESKNIGEHNQENERPEKRIDGEAEFKKISRMMTTKRMIEKSNEKNK